MSVLNVGAVAWSTARERGAGGTKRDMDEGGGGGNGVSKNGEKEQEPGKETWGRRRVPERKIKSRKLEIEGRGFFPEFKSTVDLIGRGSSVREREVGGGDKGGSQGFRVTHENFPRFYWRTPGRRKNNAADPVGKLGDSSESKAL